MYNNVEFNKTVEVLGDTLSLFISALPTGQSTRAKILEEHGVVPETGKWYSLKSVIEAYHEIGGKVGSSTLFMLGKATAEKAKLPPFENLEQALHGLNVGYHMNHRLKDQEMFNSSTGEITQGIGNYSCTKFDNNKSEAIMFCDNPYPSRFDEGIITQLLRTFRPKDSVSQRVTLDSSKENRDLGGKSCSFILTW